MTQQRPGGVSLGTGPDPHAVTATKTEVADRYLPFQVVSEPWIAYQLEDGARLRIKFVLLKLIRGDGPSPRGQNSALVASQVLVVAEVPESLRGAPGPLPTADQAMKEIEADVTFDSPSLPPAIYTFEEGRVLVVNTRLSRASRTRMTAPDGDRVYHVETNSEVVVVNNPSQLKPIASAPGDATTPGSTGARF